MTSHKTWGFALLNLVLAGVVLATVGCGDGRVKRFPVSGTLYVDDAPLQLPGDFAGIRAVQFVPVSGGRAAYANVEDDGTFKTGMYEDQDGMPAGDYYVGVVVCRTDGESAGKRVNLVAGKFENPKKSGIRVTVDKNAADLEIRVTSK